MYIRIKIYYTQIFNNLQTNSALFKRKGNKQKHKDYEKGYSLFFGGTIRNVNSLSHAQKRKERTAIKEFQQTMRQKHQYMLLMTLIMA